MISGAMRGKGGDALAHHLLKPENDSVQVIEPRGLGSEDLVMQVRELVAISSGGRTDRGVYHVHADPDLSIEDSAGARARWWSLFEREFGLTAQPYCGARHVKHGRMHEHRVYSLVLPSGAVVDLAWDFLRREKCSRIVEFEFGVAAVPSKHARAIERRLRDDGHTAVSDWLVASGTVDADRPVATLSPVERIVQERTGIALDDVRRAALEAWRSSEDGAAFEAALPSRGLALRAGRSGPVVVDAAGEAHLATRLLGSAARRFEGERIPAAAVRARLAGLQLKEMGDGRDDGGDPEAARRAGSASTRNRGGSGATGNRGGGERVLGLDRGVVRPDGRGVGHGVRGGGPALRRLRALPPVRGAAIRRRLTFLHAGMLGCDAAVARARYAAERLEAEMAYDQRRAWALWGLTDIWGIPLT